MRPRLVVSVVVVVVVVALFALAGPRAHARGPEFGEAVHAAGSSPRRPCALTRVTLTAVVVSRAPPANSARAASLPTTPPSVATISDAAVRGVRRAGLFLLGQSQRIKVAATSVT